MHPGSKRFHELLAMAGEMHDQKQADYGTDTDPFANVRSTCDWGVPAYVGALIRLNDKVQRLKSMVRGNKLRNESAYDSFLDIAVYALIGYVLLEEQEADGNVPVRDSTRRENPPAKSGASSDCPRSAYAAPGELYDVLS